MSQETIELLERIFRIADTDEPDEKHGYPLIKTLACQAIGHLKQPKAQPSSEFTTKIRDRWLAEAPHTDSTLDYAICAILNLCKRLDNVEAINKDLLAACELALHNEHKRWGEIKIVLIAAISKAQPKVEENRK
jgi:hypothetical protein